MVTQCSQAAKPRKDSEIYECGVSELTNKLLTYDRVLGVKRMTTAPFLRGKSYCLGQRDLPLLAPTQGEF